MTRPPSIHSARARGFTLLEALVTLVIVALIVATLMQALAQALGMRARLLRFQREASIAALQEQWFRESVSSAFADLPEGLDAARGTPMEFSFASAAPLVRGGVERITWSVHGNSGKQELHYAGPSVQRVRIMAGPLEDVAFSYSGRDGAWHRTWPPREDSVEVLPRLVRFEAESPSGRIVWLVHIPVEAEIQPFLTLKELAGEG